MTSTLVHDDLQRVSDLLAAAQVGAPEHGGLPDALLRGLQDLIGCDVAGFGDFDVEQQAHHLDQEVEGAEVRVWQGCAVNDEAFWRHYWTTAFCSYPSRTGDDRTVTLLSDFYSVREWRSTPMYADVFAGDRIDRELMCCLPAKGARERRILLLRSGGPDFSDRDRMLLALLRPHLAELHAPPVAAPVLTSRQTELLRLVAAGRSTAEIAQALFVSTSTVRKHLENIFDRLGVSNRTAAVVRVFGQQLTPG